MPAPLEHRVVRESTLSGGALRQELQLRLRGQEDVPAVLLLPAGDRPEPGALLIHGYTSRKEHMEDGVGRALLRRGIGSLAIDLPLHGTRRETVQSQAAWSPTAIMKQWRLATAETRLGVRYLRARREIDRERVAVVGYSLGSFLAVAVAAEDPELRAVVVAAGGDLPSQTPFAALARMVTDPLRAVKKLDGRPLLIVHGRNDRTVLPEQAQRLYDAAPEPKEIRWLDAGHRLPASAIDDAAEWLARALANPQP